MSKIERINELLLEELGQAINREVKIEGALITISYVKCSPDLKQAKIGFSVLPDRLAGTALRKLNSSTSLLIGVIRSRMRLRQLPKFIWEFDATERDASRIEKLIDEANNQDDDLPLAKV